MARVKGPNKKRFEKIFTEGMRASGPILRVLRLPGTGLMGATTPRKIGARPQRNHERRRLQNAFLSTVGNQPEWDVVLIAAGSMPKISYLEVQAEVLARWQDLEARWAESLASS